MTDRIKGDDGGDPNGVTVVVMAYDEVTTLEVVVRELHEACRQLKRPFELILVDDGSRDGTGALADSLARELDGARVLHHGGNEGLGAVYRSGFREAAQALVTFFPADGEYPASILALFLEAISGQDIVLGTLPERHCPWISRVLSWAERTLIRFFFGEYPPFQGLMMVRRSLLKRLRLVSTGLAWTVQTEVILRALRLGCPIKNVPTGHRPRSAGRSKVNNLRTMASHLVGIYRLHRALAREERQGRQGS